MPNLPNLRALGAVRCFESTLPPAEKLKFLNRCEKRQSSWCISESHFLPLLTRLRQDPPATAPEAGLINESSGKYVWKIDCDSPEGKMTVAYKTNPGKTPWRYIFKSSLPVREVRNYFLFEILNLPVARVIAVGDERKNFILTETFIATEFLENTSDGRQFMPGGAKREEREKLMAFSRKNLELLAQLHHAGIFHKAFHPRNMLWREGAEGLEIFWIDVARCRKVPPRSMKQAIIKDLHTFFRDMRLTKAETVELLETYTAQAPKAYLPVDNSILLEKLIHFRRRLFSRKKYQIFSGE